MTTAEGGMITTNDPRLARRLRLLRSHGMTVSSWDRENGRPSHYDVLEFGFNFRMDDIRAAVGLVQLEKLAGFNRRRAELAARYNDGLSGLRTDLILPFASIPATKSPSYHIYPVVFRSPEERALTVARLNAEGIQTSMHYPPIHRLSAFTKNFPGLCLPHTEAFASRELTLPLYPTLSVLQIDRIVSGVEACLREIGPGPGIAARRP